MRSVQVGPFVVCVNEELGHVAFVSAIGGGALAVKHEDRAAFAYAVAKFFDEYLCERPRIVAIAQAEQSSRAVEPERQSQETADPKAPPPPSPRGPGRRPKASKGSQLEGRKVGEPNQSHGAGTSRKRRGAAT